LAGSAWGVAGAAGLAVLLRDRAHRHLFVAAANAVALAMALYMAMSYGDPDARFLADGGVRGPDAGAAFLLVPILVAAAVLYGKADDEEWGYRKVILTALTLLVLLVAGLRTGSAAWLYAVGVGVATAAWLILPRLRLAALALGALVLLAAAHGEVRQGAVASDYLNEARPVREAVLDRADWGLVRSQPLGRLLFGSGVGTYFLALDGYRPPATYAVPHGDSVVAHARRELTEAICERGLVGLGLALAVGVACVAAGVMACRRAKDRLDASLGAGLAAAALAAGVFACFSNGALTFGAGVVFWVALGVLGALSIESGRPAALSWSPEEELGRGEAAPRGHRARAAVAALGCLVALGAWWALGARPFWGEYCLQEGQAEFDTSKSLGEQRSMAAAALRQMQAVAKQARADLDESLEAAEEKLRAATKKAQAEAELDALRTTTVKRRATLAAAVKGAEEGYRSAADTYAESRRRAEKLLRRAARLSLGDAIWLNAHITLARYETAGGSPQAAADRYRRLDAACGHAFDLDLLRAACCVQLRLPEEAQRLFARYAARNPCAATTARFPVRAPLYGPWLMFISNERHRQNPKARAWADDYIAAASQGLALAPDHYGLLLFRGEMLYQLGEMSRSRDDMIRASMLIERALADAKHPFAQANLFVELANANSHWNKAKALKAAEQVFALNIDQRDPLYREVLQKAGRIRSILAPPPKAPAEGTPPPAEAPQPPGAGEN